jgi:lysophospholipase L1-like esterase
MDVNIPVTLTIDRNRANLYMAFGDSISAGQGSRDGEGYRSWLTGDLTNYFGRADIANEGDAGTRSNIGVERMGLSLATVRPAFSLIMYGTNDWNQPECKNVVGPACFTVGSLRHMIGLARSVKSMPIMATIPPVNPDFTDKAPQARQDWVAGTNELIREMAASQNTILADVHAEMLAAGPLPALFADHVHPNTEGYIVIARAFFKALTDASLRPTAQAPGFGFTGPGESSSD